MIEPHWGQVIGDKATFYYRFDNNYGLKVVCDTYKPFGRNQWRIFKLKFYGSADHEHIDMYPEEIKHSMDEFYVDHAIIAMRDLEV